jgi:hypothetical protein
VRQGILMIRLTSARRHRSLSENRSSRLLPRGPPVLSAAFAGTALDQQKRQRTRYLRAPQSRPQAATERPDD